MNKETSGAISRTSFLKMTPVFLFTAALVQMTVSSAYAESFKILGARPLGMGGAFVAVAEDSLAQYWNPAGIAKQKKFDLEIPVNVKIEFTGGILQDVNTISDLADNYSKVQESQNDGLSMNVDEMASLFATVDTMGKLNQPGKGVLLEVQGGLGLRIMRLALSVNNFTSAGGVPFVDTTNVGLGGATGVSGVSFTGTNTSAPSDSALVTARNNARDAIDTVGFSNIQNLIGASNLTAAGITNSEQLANVLVNEAQKEGVSTTNISEASLEMKNSAESARTIITNAASGNPYSENTTNITLRGISMTEIAIGYGHRFFHDDLFWGANLKAIVGTVGFFKQEILKGSVGGGDVLDDFNTNTKQTIQPGIDLGLMLDKRTKWRTKVGIVARNVNSPKFDQPVSGEAAGEPKFKVEPQVRAGIALYPFKRTFWVITSDLDITNNKTPVPGFSSRMWGLGTEINLVNSNLFNLALRAGLMKNLAEKSSKPTWTGGIELKLLHFFVSLAGAISSQREEIKGLSSESQEVPQNAQVGIAFGLDW